MTTQSCANFAATDPRAKQSRGKSFAHRRTRRSGFPFCDLAARCPGVLSAGSESSGRSTRGCAAELARGTIHLCQARVLLLGLPETRVRP
jgi:hypothetical protein